MAKKTFKGRPIRPKNCLHVFDAETETGRRVEPEDIVIQGAHASPHTHHGAGHARLAWHFLDQTM